MPPADGAAATAARRGVQQPPNPLTAQRAFVSARAVFTPLACKADAEVRVLGDCHSDFCFFSFRCNRCKPHLAPCAPCAARRLREAVRGGGFDGPLRNALYDTLTAFIFWLECTNEVGGSWLFSGMGAASRHSPR